MGGRKLFALGLALAVLLLAGAFFVRENSLLLPPCPLHSMTGLHCPGCGVTRATRALLHGDLATALKMNALAVILMPLIVIMIGREITAWHLQKPKWRAGTGGRWGIALGFAVILYGVLRNLPGFEFLKPGG